MIEVGVGVNVGGLLLAGLGMAVLMITVSDGMINSGGGVSMIGVALGMNIAGQAGTSSMPGFADNTISHRLGSILQSRL